MPLQSLHDQSSQGQPFMPFLYFVAPGTGQSTEHAHSSLSVWTPDSCQRKVTYTLCCAFVATSFIGF